MLLQKSNLPQKITFTQEDGIQNVFIRDEIIGTGTFSIVYRVTHQNTNKIYAMKVISKGDFSKSKLALMDLENEIKIQNLVNHPNVVKSDFSFSDAQNHYFILEYCPGGNIRNYLRKNKQFRLSEPEIRKIIKDVIKGLDYIHGLKIIHHDIKLENLVIDSNGNVKIADFGLSNFEKNENEKKSVIFGTLKYLSPEMLQKGSKMKSCKIDIWAVGISTFYLLTGSFPFFGLSEKKMMQCIKKGELHFPLNYEITDEIKDFINKMLQIDPEMRPTAKELLNHPFLKIDDNDNVCLYKKPLIMTKDETMKKNPDQQQKQCRETDQKKKNENSKPSILQPLCQNGQICQKNQTENLKPSLCENGQICQKNQTENLKPIKSPDLVSQKQHNRDLKPTFCPLFGSNKIISPRRPNENLNSSLCQPLNGSRPVSQRQQNGDLKPSFCPPLNNDNKLISPRKLDDNLKPLLRPPQNRSRPVSQRRKKANLKPSLNTPRNRPRTVTQKWKKVNLKSSLRPPRNRSRPVSQKQKNANLNTTFCPPLNGSKPASQRQQAGDLKQTFCLQPNDNKIISPEKPNDNLNSSLRPPSSDNKTISPEKSNDNLNSSLRPPLIGSMSVSQRQQTGDLKPSFCLPPNDSKLISPEKPNDNLNSSFCPPPSDSKLILPEKPNDNLNSSFCPPPSDSKLISPEKPNDNLNSSFCPPLNDSKPVSQGKKAGDLKKSHCPPPIDNKPISPITPNSKLRKARFPPRQIAAYSIIACRNQSCIEDFIIPSYFVSRYSLYNNNLSYLLFDGTVGFCFKDKSRIVMEPKEQFAQFYKDPNTKFPDIICLSNLNEKNEHEKITLMKKAARNFKKIRFSYELEDISYDPDYVFHNINCFVKYEDSILFKLDGMNFQVNFNDHSKLIIFWNLKKFCFFKSFNEFSTLLDLKNVTSMNPDSDELKKIKQANILLSKFSLTIC